jgi:hypothetical protein
MYRIGRTLPNPAITHSMQEPPAGVRGKWASPAVSSLMRFATIFDAGGRDSQQQLTGKCLYGPMSLKRERRVGSYSITSSASASKVGVISSPSAFAVLRLTVKSNLFGSCTGKSAGVVPLRIWSTYDAAPR